MELIERESLPVSRSVQMLYPQKRLQEQRREVLAWLRSLQGVTGSPVEIELWGGPKIRVFDHKDGLSYFIKQVEKWYPKSPMRLYKHPKPGKKRFVTDRSVPSVKDFRRVLADMTNELRDEFRTEISGPVRFGNDLVITNGACLVQFLGMGSDETEFDKLEYMITRKVSKWIDRPVDLEEPYHIVRMAKGIEAQEVWMYRNPDGTLALLANGPEMAQVRWNTQDGMRYMNRFGPHYLECMFLWFMEVGHREVVMGQVKNWLVKGTPEHEQVAKGSLLDLQCEDMRIVLAPMTHKVGGARAMDPQEAQ